jgi:hypothetical protein
MGLSLKSLGRKIVDVFSADTQADQQRRVAAGQPRLYAEQQRAAGVQHPATNPAAAIFGGAARLANTVGSGGREISDTARMIAANVSHNPVAFRNVNQANVGFKQKAYQPNSGLLGAGNMIFNNPGEFDTLGAGDITKRVAAGTLETAGEVLPVGRGLSVAKQGLRVVPKIAAQGAAIGAAGNVGSQYINTGKVNPKQVVLSAAAGGTLSVVPPLVAAGVKRLPKVTKASMTKNTGKAVSTRPLDSKTQTTALSEVKADRPYNDLQTQVEIAHNAGDKKLEAQLVKQLPDQGMNPSAALTPARRAEIMAKAGLAPPKVTSKQRGFVTSVKESPEVSPTVQEKVSGIYDVRSTKTLADRSQALVKNLDKSTTDIRARLDKPIGTVDDQAVSDAITLAKAHDSKGSFQTASDIYDKLAEHLTKSGQTIQAASLLDNMTSEGLRFRGMRELKRAGVKVTPDLESKIKDSLDKVRAAKPGTPEHSYAVQTYKKVISDSIPADVADKLTSVWKAGLLTGLRTQTGNVLSNTTFGVMHGVSEPLAVAIDKAIGLFTGKRAKTLTFKGVASGTVEGTRKGAKYLKTGVDELSQITNKFDQREIKFKNKVLNTYVNGVFRAMGAADKPFRYAQLRNSLYDLGKADGLTKGFQGAQLKKYVDNFVANPPKRALQTATDEAARAVLGNETYLSKVAGRIRQAAESVGNPAGKTLAKTATGVLMPFTKVPSAFISRVFDFTPVGAIKEAVIQISKRRLDQRTLATALSEATTGTGIIYLGAELANNGMLSGSYPNDPKEQARWKAEGIQPNSIKVGDTWLSLNYFGPVGALFSQGKRAVDTIAEGGGKTDVAAGFTGGAAQDALGQSFLQGVSGALDAVQDPKRYAAGYAKNQTGSVVPTLVKDIAEATDQKQRVVNNPVEAVQARIPGARKGLRPTQDVYGNELERKSSAANTMVNPFRPSDSVANSVKNEVRRLHEADPNNKDLQVTPTPVDKTLRLDGSRTKLTDKQRYDLQKNIGQATQDLWNQVMQTAEYKGLGDVEKAELLNRTRLDMTAVVEHAYAADNKIGPYASEFTGKVKDFTRREAAIIDGQFSVADYLFKPKTSTTRSIKTPKTSSGGRKISTKGSKKASTSRTPTGSPYKYAVSPNVGTSAASRRVTLKGPARPKIKSKARSKIAAAPKVSAKKSTA